ncbi:phage major capsid protein [Terrabacter sp. 2TAF16]|uniref:phage major capsid protein n=1 Tax=Terrabacter sp. 2TAF16 TaxID=3233008 RepID=UPI003F95B724
MTIHTLIEQVRAAMATKLQARTAQKAILDSIRAAAAADGNRDLTADEATRSQAAAAELRQIDGEIEAQRTRIAELESELARDEATDALAREIHWTQPAARGLAGGQPAASARGSFVRADDLQPATVARGTRFCDHEVVAASVARSSQRDAAVTGQHGSLGQLVRAMSTASGSAIVPTVWFGDIIDRARNLSAVIQAGAEIVPMDAKTVQIGRLTGDPTAAFRAEGSTITASDPTFDNVTLTATTMSTLVVGSLEWFQDANNVDEIVANAIAEAFALQLDLVALYGSVTTGAGTVNLPTPPNPRGVLGTLNAVAASSVLGGAANGTTQTPASFYNELLDLAFTPRDYNEAPNALIWNAKAARQYAKAYDTTGQPLRMPADVEALQRFTTNQVPSYTQGTMTGRATDVFTGDWTQLLIGQRLDLTIQTLTERYAENGQVGIVAHWRGDVGVARPRAFAVYKALQGA